MVTSTMLGSRIKRVKGRDYLYYVVHSEGKRTDVYCGLASDPRSHIKVKEIELSYWVIQKKVVSDKIIKLKSEIAELKKQVSD